jgi:hypothetical protein
MISFEDKHKAYAERISPDDFLPALKEVGKVARH